MARIARRVWLLGTSALLAWPLGRANTVSAEIAAELPGARLQGSSTMRFIGMRIYDARLWTLAPTPELGSNWTAADYALELEYARELKGEQIAERSLAEMRRQGDIAADTAQRWLAQMKQLFPDVASGDRITGVHRVGKAARFFVNGKLRGEVMDADFARYFFGIWLSPRTSEPSLRAALLGSAR